jgi:anti-sigma regulatory factor (Ser/Thr protein kinase)
VAPVAGAVEPPCRSYLRSCYTLKRSSSSRPQPPGHPSARPLQSAVLDDVKLVANELASNSISHSGLGERDLIEVAISSQSGHMRIDVADGGAGFTLPDEGVRRGGGRGLPMVQRLSRRFGFAHDGVTHAWAEITLDVSRPGR